MYLGFYSLLNQCFGVCAFADIVEIVFGNYAACEGVTISEELDTAQRGVDTFAVIVVLRPNIDNGVDIAACVRASVCLNQRRAIPVKNSRTRLVCGADIEIAGEPLVFGFFVAIVQAEVEFFL
jgi:hypothetical protein